MNHLLIFDIDGTLTQTNDIDTVCFVQAVTEHLHIDRIDTRWERYKYSTDSGILSEIFHRYLHRDPTRAEILKIQNRFIKQLESAFQSTYPCKAVNGAVELINQLQAQNQYKVAIATGCWEVSANLKLNAAGINHHSITKAYCDHHFERTDIILDAIAQSQKYHQQDFEKITYIGDRKWDHDAAKALSIQFIGVGDAFCDQQYGIIDFSQPEELFSCLIF